MKFKKRVTNVTNHVLGLFFWHCLVWLGRSDHFCGEHKMINGNGKWPEKNWIIRKGVEKNKKWYLWVQRYSRISKWILFLVVLSSMQHSTSSIHLVHPSSNYLLPSLNDPPKKPPPDIFVLWVFDAIPSKHNLTYFFTKMVFKD